jgi:hypothetical protein
LIFSFINNLFYRRNIWCKCRKSRDEEKIIKIKEEEKDMKKEGRKENEEEDLENV